MTAIRFTLINRVTILEQSPNATTMSPQLTTESSSNNATTVPEAEAVTCVTVAVNGCPSEGL